MAIHTYDRGNKIRWTEKPIEDSSNISMIGHWEYLDGQRNNPRPCVRCGKTATSEGYDACIGRIKGVTSACCGHGVERPYIVLANGVLITFMKNIILKDVINDQKVWDEIYKVLEKDGVKCV